MFWSTGLGLFLMISQHGVLKSGAIDAATRRALLARGVAKAPTSTLDHGVRKKDQPFCTQTNPRLNFDKTSLAIAGVASNVKDVRAALHEMSANFTKEMKTIANGIEDLSHKVEEIGADLLQHIIAVRRFLESAKADIDLGLLAVEVLEAMMRIANRQSLLELLFKDKGALTPEKKQELVTAILDINAGSGIDTWIIHDVLTGAGQLLPGLEPSLDVYKSKGYRLGDLAKVYSALLVYQMHGYGQLLWADLNKRSLDLNSTHRHSNSTQSHSDVQLLPYSLTQRQVQDRLQAQWQKFGSPFMWHCYWDDGVVCPETQECYTSLRGLDTFACNYATAPLSIDTTTGSTSFTLGAASSDLQLQITRDTRTSTCVFGVKDCNGQIHAPVPYNATSKATNFSCSSAVTVELDGGMFTLWPKGKAVGSYILADVSTSHSSAYSLFVGETGEVSIIGDHAQVLWTQAAPSASPTGVCPTDFTKRQLKPLTMDSCSCIKSAKWRQVASGRVNMTASWCGRMCQADSQYVASAPRADGECWCATPEVYKQTLLDSLNCEATCPLCPGAPVDACGLENSVAVFTWTSAVEHSQSILM